MKLRYEILNQVIPIDDVIEHPKSNEKLSSTNSNLIASTHDIKLRNFDKLKYDDRFSGSLFYGVGWYNQPANIFDEDTGSYLWKGRIKNIQVSDKSNIITVKTANYIKDLTDTTCVHYDLTNDITPAQVILDILTNESMGAIPLEHINMQRFSEAISIQEANSLFIDTNYGTEDGKKCMSVINELMRFSHCDMSTIDNIINIFQWKKYNGMIGDEVNENHINVQSYDHEYSNELFNHYYIIYNNAGTLSTVEGENATSISRYGKKTFLIPNEKVDDADISKFKILLRNSTGAKWSGETALERHAFLRKFAKFQLNHKKKYLKPNDQIDLCNEGHYREPTRIIERKFDTKNGQSDIKVEFLNTPTEYFPREINPPEPILLQSATPNSDGSIELQWQKIDCENFLAYKLYFTSTLGEWEDSFCYLGRSPVLIKSFEVNQDGLCSKTIHGLDFTKYSFKMSVLDTVFQESEMSNILNAINS